MIELKSTLNLRLSGDANVSFTLSHLSEDETVVEDASNMGEMMKIVSQAWAHGYDSVDEEAE